MRSKAESLRLIVTVTLRPLEAAEYPPLPRERPRELDPLWQVGHAAFDACRALVSPFAPAAGLETKFGDQFHGRRSVEPWERQRPESQAVFEWWREILKASEETLESRRLDQALPEPIDFTAYTVSTVGEAYDYVVYHTSFHAGLAQAALYRAAV